MLLWRRPAKVGIRKMLAPGLEAKQEGDLRGDGGGGRGCGYACEGEADASGETSRGHHVVENGDFPGPSLQWSHRCLSQFL